MTTAADLAPDEPTEMEDVVEASAALALHHLLNAPGPAPGRGDPLPVLWHWLAFLPRVPQVELAVDGHPSGTQVLDEAGTPLRRMFAGGRVHQLEPLPVGERLRRRSSVQGIEHKSGRSGSLVFVTWRHEISRACEHHASPALIEEQDLVYRAPESQSASAPFKEAASELQDDEWDWLRDLEITPTLLFRFSALTYNAHRIHYDRAYAETVEGYRGLVVHGPLQAIALAELCRQALPDQATVRFEFRALRPAFDAEALRLRGRRNADNQVELAAFDGAGRRTMTAVNDLETIKGQAEHG